MNTAAIYPSVKCEWKLTSLKYSLTLFVVFELNRMTLYDRMMEAITLNSVGFNLKNIDNENPFDTDAVV